MCISYWESYLYLNKKPCNKKLHGFLSIYIYLNIKMFFLFHPSSVSPRNLRILSQIQASLTIISLLSFSANSHLSDHPDNFINNIFFFPIAYNHICILFERFHKLLMHRIYRFIKLTDDIFRLTASGSGVPLNTAL